MTRTEEPTVGAPITRIAAAVRRLPWWAAVLLVYAASRVVTTGLFAWVSTTTTTQSRAGLQPSLLDLASAWDGAWYWTIAVSGYPAVLPVGPFGDVQTNPWAFLPLYPALAKLLAFGVVDWRIAAVLVSIASGAVAAVLLAALLRPRVGDGGAVFAAAVLAFGPLSFVLQMTYAEALGLALLFGALLLIDRRRYRAAIVPAVLLAFTRPGALALALAVAIVVVVRWSADRRTGHRTPPAEVIGGAVLAAVTAVAGLAWNVVAALATGRVDAYVATEAAWRSLWTDRAQIVLFEAWLFAARFWTSKAFGPASAPVVGPLLLTVVVVGFAALVSSRPVRRLGLAVVAWCASYALYLLAVFFPQSSLFRLLLPVAPLAGALDPRRAMPRAAVLTICVLLQAAWMWVVVGPVQAYWTVL